MLVDYFPGGCAPVIRALVRTGELTYYESKIVAFDVIVLRLRALLR